MMLLTLCGTRNRQLLSACMLRMAGSCAILVLLSNQPQQRYIHLSQPPGYIEGANGKQTRVF